MKSYDGRWIIMLNGEIYNYKELAVELKKISLIKYGDTRVLTELIAKNGIEVFKKIKWDVCNRYLRYSKKKTIFSKR